MKANIDVRRFGGTSRVEVKVGGMVVSIYKPGTSSAMIINVTRGNEWSQYFGRKGAIKKGKGYLNFDECEVSWIPNDNCAESQIQKVEW